MIDPTRIATRRNTIEGRAAYGSVVEAGEQLRSHLLVVVNDAMADDLAGVVAVADGAISASSRLRDFATALRDESALVFVRLAVDADHGVDEAVAAASDRFAVWNSTGGVAGYVVVFF